MEDLSRFRETEYPVDALFRDRWSPRAMSGEPVPREELMTLLEAARWAPSSYNNQPWRIFYALRDNEHWETFFDLLVEMNQSWAKNAAALCVFCSKKTFDNGEPSITHVFDTGSAWENFALQGALHGLVVHGMQGFDYDRAHRILGLSDEFEVLAMAAVGRPGRVEDLPEALQEREVPSGRKPLSAIAFEGPWERAPE